MDTTGSAALFPVHVTGADATSFLHAQFCGDLLALSEGGVCITGWCSPGGRVLTTVLARCQGQDWLLLLPAGLAERMLQRLRLYVLRSRVTLQPAAPGEIVPALQGAAAGLLPAPGNTWNAAHVSRGIPWITAPTSEVFLPQELGLERFGGLSYGKGCYPGQEIVARLHFRGEVKRGPFQFTVPATAAAAAVPGARLEDSDGKAVGTVLYAAPADADGAPLLAIVDFAHRDTQALYLAPHRAPATSRGPCA